MAVCNNDIRLAILNDVYSELAKNRYTFSRISDDTIQINNRIDNQKSKAKSNAQAFRIAEEMLSRVENIYNGHVKGYINQPSPYDPISITFIPSQSYIDHEMEKYKNGRLFFQQTPDVQYTFKAVQNIFSNINKVENWWKQLGNTDAFWNKLQADLQIPKAQIQLLKNSEGNNVGEKLSSFVANYSYAVEINTAKEKGKDYRMVDRGDGNFEPEQIEPEFDYEEVLDEEGNIIDMRPVLTEKGKKQIADMEDIKPTKYYSNLTVPGGTNYTENEISTPLITPSIKGHASFSTDKGIGWFRSDDRQKVKGTSIYTKEQADRDLRDGKISEFEYEMASETFGVESPTETDTKTRRILEVQSDLFQKGRDLDDLVTKQTKKSLDDFSTLMFNLNRRLDNNEISLEDYRKERQLLEDNQKFWKNFRDLPDNQFLQLLNKDNNWVTFFIKSIIQDSAKKGYEKVLFPSGNTASKVEGHSTLEEFKKQKEDRIKELEESKTKKEYTITDDYGQTHIVKTDLEKINKEINQLKQELERVEKEGFGALRPIYNFYENTVTNILKKQGYNPVEITDEYGNKWNEVRITNKEKENILLQKNPIKQSIASPKTLARVKEFLKRNKIDIEDMDGKYDANGAADLLNNLIYLAEGKEGVALTEEAAHFAVEMIEQQNPALFKQMLNKIGKYEMYQLVLDRYASDPIYQEDGKPNIRKLKKEAMTKVLAEYIIEDNEKTNETAENIAQVLTWWDRIKEWIKNLLKIASFNPFEEAAKEFNTLQGTLNSSELYFQLSDTQKKIVDEIKQTENNIQKVVIPKTEGTIDADDDDNNYYEAKQPDGSWKRVQHRVTNRALEFKQGLFGKNKKFTDEEKKYNNILRTYGINGHSDMEDIINRYVDASTGQKKSSPDPFPPVSKIMPQDRTLTAYRKLDTYVRDLINSFPEDSVFLPETIIYDGLYKGGEAGTVDLIVIEPDGKTHILDWKFINNAKDDIAGWKQGAFNIQIGRYKEILKNRYGIKSFGQTRAIPIMMDMKPYRTLNSSTFTLDGIAIGSADPKKIEELKLLPVPTEEERTGNDVIDRQLDRIAALNKKVKGWKPGSDEEKEAKRFILDSLRLATRALQTQENVVPMVESAENVYIPSSETTLEEFEKFLQRDKSEPSDVEISDMSKEIDDAIRMADVYSSMGDDFSEIVQDEELKQRMDTVSRRVREIKRKLEKARKEHANKFIGERNDIPDIYKAETVIKGLTRIFTSSSQLPMRTVQALVKLYRKAAFTSQSKSLEFGERVKTITDRIQDKKKAYSLIFKKDDKGRRVHELISEFNPEFGKQLRSKSGEQLVEFLKKNINYSEYLKAVEEHLDSILDKLSGPNAENQREKILAKFDPKNPNFQAQNTFIWQFIDRDKWESKEYKALKQNKEAFELYSLARELGKKAAELGYIDYMEQFRFLPFFRKGLIDKLFTGGNISPIQDIMEGLATSGEVYGEVDPLSGEKRYTLPKYGKTDISTEAIDEQGKTYRDYSNISDDIGRILVAFSMELNRYEAIDSIIGQVEALRHIEEFKGHIRTNKFSIPARDEKDAVIIDAGNDENLGVFEAIEQYLIYGNKYPLTTHDSDLGLSTATKSIKKFLNKVGMATTGHKVFKNEEGVDTPTSAIKGIEALNRFTQMKVLGLSPLPALANFAGLHIQMLSQSGRFYPYKDWIASEKEALSFRFGGKDNREMIAQLLHTFMPLVEDPNRKLWKEVGINKIEGNTLQDYLFIGFQKPEVLAQYATFISLLKNFIVKDGKIVPIVDAVREEFSDYQEYIKNKDKRIAELKKQSIWNTKKLVDGKLEIPGFDMNNLEERQKLGLQARAISKAISGNMSEEDVSRASMDIFFKSMMVFKNWIPKLVETRFGGLKKSNEYYNKDMYDIGKVRLFWHVFVNHSKLRINKIRNILKANNAGMEDLNKLYDFYKKDYENRHGEEFTMTPSQFNDMVRRNLNNQVRELILLFSMLALFMTIGFMEPPEDKQQKAIFNTTKRMIDQTINELSFFYVPSNWSDMLSQGIFPALSSITDVEKFIFNLSAQITGIDFKPSTEGSEEVREHAQPVKYLFKLVPALRQGVNYMALFSPDMAKEMDINVPPAESY